jgi:acyl-CoA synthetase (AMP-forming)/AMP-acid ligase II
VLTIGGLARHNQRTWAHHLAYADQRRRVTWGEFGARTDALGRALRAEGIGPGDRVAMIATDCVEIAELMVACAKIGAVRVGINHRLSAREISAMIDDAEPALVLVQDEHSALANDAVAKARTSVQRIAFGLRASEYEELITRHSSEEPLEMTPNDLLMICYTTGSTGLPKGALYTHQNVLQSMINIALCEGAFHDDVWLHTMPAGGVPILHMCRNLYQASSTVILGKWDPDRALEVIERERVTIAVFVPTMLASMLASKSAGSTNTSSFRQFEYGGSPIPPATIRAAMDLFMCPFLQMYGTTELTGMSHMLFPSDHRTGLESDPRRLASIGRALPYAEQRIVDDNGNDVPVGEVGELVISTDLAVPGYWRNQDKYAELVKNGWLYTGDLGHMDEQGYVYLVDRKMFRIKSGGYNVFPVEVENVLAEHPSVREVSVVGVPDPTWGERVHAVVVLEYGSTTEGAELIAFCRGRIAGFKVPKSVEIRDDLPRGATGKILKRQLRDEAPRVTSASSPRSRQLGLERPVPDRRRS